MKPVIRNAEIEDIPLLATHHRKMFEEILEKKGKPPQHADCEAAGRAYAEKLAQELNRGACTAWIVEADGRIAASGAVTIVSFVPTPIDPFRHVAYLHSIYTEKPFRGRRLATLIVKTAMRHCRDRGVRRIILTASAAGRPVYENLGFRTATELMTIMLDP